MNIIDANITVLGQKVYFESTDNGDDDKYIKDEFASIVKRHCIRLSHPAHQKERLIMEEAKLTWHKPEDSLPPEGEYVLVHHNLGNWTDNTDQENVDCVVAKMTHGISLAERDALPKGDTRKGLHKACDESGNNERNYGWFTFGALQFFGQNIDCWCYIPDRK